MPALFTTEPAPSHRRLALWQDIVCDVFVELDCRSDRATDFHGAITSAMVGNSKCSEVISTQQHVRRTPSRISRANGEFILFALGGHGVGGVQQDGRETVIRPGEFAFYDTTRPYELKFNGDFRQTIFQVPRESLRRRVSGIENLTAISFTPDRPLEKLAFSFISSVAEIAGQLEADTAQRLADQAIDLVAVAMSERLGAAPLSSSSHRAALLCRIKTYILAHLHDPDLNLGDTAVALGISSRYVNDLLADEATSFQRYVLAQRLERCKRDLSSPMLAQQHVGEIAFRWGFSDLSHFGRAFREQFGMPPRDWRQSRSSN
jgi:AraC-like DNA-binding protein